MRCVLIFAARRSAATFCNIYDFTTYLILKHIQWININNPKRVGRRFEIVRCQTDDGFHAFGVSGVDVDVKPEITAQFGKRCRGGAKNAAFPIRWVFTV